MFDTAPDIMKPPAGLMDRPASGVGDSMLDKASKLLKDQREAAKESSAKPPGSQARRR